MKKISVAYETTTDDRTILEIKLNLEHGEIVKWGRRVAIAAAFLATAIKSAPAY